MRPAGDALESSVPSTDACLDAVQPKEGQQIQSIAGGTVFSAEKVNFISSKWNV